MEDKQISNASEASKKKLKKKLHSELITHCKKENINGESKKIRLDFDDDEAITVGLIRLTKPVSYHQFFFDINRCNEFQFHRTEDFITQNGLTEYEFLSMQGYDKGEKLLSDNS